MLWPDLGVQGLKLSPLLSGSAHTAAQRQRTCPETQRDSAVELFVSRSRIYDSGQTYQVLFNNHTPVVRHSHSTTKTFLENPDSSHLLLQQRRLVVER